MPTSQRKGVNNNNVDGSQESFEKCSVRNPGYGIYYLCYHIYGLRWGKAGIYTLAKYKSPSTAPLLSTCILLLVSCNIYNDKSSLPGGKLMVDSLSPYVLVGLYIDRCIRGAT